MALGEVESRNDVGLACGRAGPTSSIEYGLPSRSRRPTDVNGETDHASEHDGRPNHTVGVCL